MTTEPSIPAGVVRAEMRDAVQPRVALSVERLSKTYPTPFARLKRLFKRRATAPVVALRDVSLEVREGEIFGLIGRNGAGKTTFAKIIATLVQPTEGTVNVRGFDSVRDEARVREVVGLASAEERSFYWRLTVEQNLTFFSRLYGLGTSDGARRIEELLELFELTALRRRRFGELSTGNKQRMAVARAMLNSPPVLLLDEPTRSLDPLAASRMRELIGSLARGASPVTILLTSHNLAEVEELCERVAVISRGRIRAVDEPRTLRAAHRNRERVRLTLRGVTTESAVELPRAALAEFGEPVQFEAKQLENGAVSVNFERESEDDTLDRALRALVEGGARVVSCETERGTLLDVLETFEREGEGE